VAAVDSPDDTIAAIVFGAALIPGSDLTPRFSHVGAYSQTPGGRMVGRAIAEMATGLQVLCDVGAVMVGLFSLVGVGGGAIPPRLACIAMLVVGSSLFLSGLAISSKIMTLLHRRS
jgi:hypothetical protein